MPFGKYKDEKISEFIKDDARYLLWAVKNVDWIDFDCHIRYGIYLYVNDYDKKKLEWDIEDLFPRSGIFQICKDKKDATGLYRILAKIYHPDAGGITAAMQIINNQYEKFCNENRR